MKFLVSNSSSKEDIVTYNILEVKSFRNMDVEEWTLVDYWFKKYLKTSFFTKDYYIVKDDKIKINFNSWDWINPYHDIIKMCKRKVYREISPTKIYLIMI